MRNIILVLALVLMTSAASFAQCDKKVKWQGAKGELKGTDGNVAETKSATFIIIADAKTISLEILEDEGGKLEGNVTETTCEWKEAFKNGKATYKTTLVRPDGNSSATTVTIEGKDGKFTAIVEMDRLEGKKVRVYLDKHEAL